MSAYHKLRGRRKKFVDAYVETRDWGKAAIASGSTSKSPHKRGWDMGQVPAVAAAIAEREADATAKAGRKASEILAAIGETLDRCMQHTPVLDKTGKPVLIKGQDGIMTAAYTFDAKNALKAAELLGNFHKLFVQRVEVEGEVVQTHRGLVGVAQEAATAIATATTANEAVAIYEQLMRATEEQPKSLQ
jgi:phage terminase small subunit